MATSTVLGVQRLIAKLRLERGKVRRWETLYGEVSYGNKDVYYAIYVHEDRFARHPVGQAKYLEEPARVEARNIGGAVNRATRRTGDLADGLLAGARYLLEVSQPYVPVDTGALKASGTATLVRSRP